MPAPTLLEPPLNEAARRIEFLRRNLARAAHDEPDANLARRESAALVKAQSYVLLSAALESYVTTILDAVIAEIGAAGRPQQDLRATLFSMWCAPTFDSLREVRGRRMWERRTELYPPIFSPNGLPAGVPYALPLDGRTLTGDHFEVIWKVFGFLPPELPGPIHGLALRDLAGGRNDVAHGNQDPVAFGLAKAVTDVTRLTQRIEDIVEHLALKADEYIRNDLFLR